VQRKMIGELCEHQPPGIHGLFPAKNPVAGSQTNSLQFKSVTATGEIGGHRGEPARRI
jgi:hypothetical protein